MKKTIILLAVLFTVSLSSVALKAITVTANGKTTEMVKDNDPTKKSESTTSSSESTDQKEQSDKSATCSKKSCHKSSCSKKEAATCTKKK